MKTDRQLLETIDARLTALAGAHALVEAQVQALRKQQIEQLNRLVRMESRLVATMVHMGIPSHKPVFGEKEAA